MSNEDASISSSFEEDTTELQDELTNEVRRMLNQRDLYWISDVPRIKALKRFYTWINKSIFGDEEEYFSCFEPFSGNLTTIQLYDGFEESSKVALLNILDQLKKGGYPCVQDEDAFKPFASHEMQTFSNVLVYKHSHRMKRIFSSILTVIKRSLHEVGIRIHDESEHSLDENYSISDNAPELVQSDKPKPKREYFFQTMQSFDEDAIIHYFYRRHPELSKQTVSSIVKKVIEEDKKT